MKTKSFFKGTLVTFFSVLALTTGIILMSSCGGSSRGKALSEADSLKGLKVRGHTLCWHNQTGEWMFKDSTGNQASKELVLGQTGVHGLITIHREEESTILFYSMLT